MQIVASHNNFSAHHYSPLEDQQVAPPTESLFWCQTYSFVFTKAFSISLFLLAPLSFRPNKYNIICRPDVSFLPQILDEL